MARSLLLTALASASIGLWAAPVAITNPFMNLENRAVNSLGFNPGQFLRIGANSAVPNGNAGTTAIGTTINLSTGQLITQTIPFSPAPVIPNFYSRLMTDSPALRGPWTLAFSNGGDTTSTIVTLPAGATQAPFVNTITLSGTSANPTFSWAPPANTTVNGYRVNIYDKMAGQVASRDFAPTTTSYTVTAADFTVPGYAFELGRNYSIEIGLLQTKDGTGNTNNSNLQAISRVYADFQPNQSNGPPVNLPVTLVNGAYQFDIAVHPGQTYYIDPLVSIGYDYRIGAGDPSFKSVVLPAGIGDGLFDIYGLDGSNLATLLAHDWKAGSVFDFGTSGVDAFRVGGIETEAGLDPANVTAFVTGLTFTGDGFFTGTQTPLTVELAVAVPEPETYALMLAGLAWLGWFARHRRSAASAVGRAGR